MIQSIKLNKKSFSIKKQLIITFFGIVLTIALPQLCHLLGIISGTGKTLGRILSPMHLPVIFVGLYAGPLVGAITGLFGPLFSFALTNMPTANTLPFMMVELLGYGLCAGLLRNINIPNTIKVIISLIAGRVLRMLFCILMIYVFKNQNEAILSIWKSVPVVLPGIILQIALIPLILHRIENN